MSQYATECDDSYAICPYCQHSYEVEGEDFSDNARQEECGECGKSYWIQQDFSVTTTTKPDCLINGATHKWELKKFSTGSSAFFCATCHAHSLVAKDGTPKKEQTA